MSDDIQESESYSETTHEGFLGRIGNSIIGVLFGFLFFGASFVLLFWNEGRAVKRARDLAEGAKAVISVDAASLNPANEGKLIHITGKAATDEKLTDPDFGISLNALRLQRQVEMYQWKEKKETETRKNAGGSKTTVTNYRYSKVWEEDVIDSDRFHHASSHRNPKSKPYPSHVESAKTILVGAFQLSPSLTDQISHYEPLPLNDEALAQLPPAVRDRVKRSGNYFYIADDPATHKIGDARIRFQAAKPGPVSVVARQKGNTFEAYRTKSGNTLEFLYPGNLTAQAIFDKEVSKNNVLTWILRACGVLCMWFGLVMIGGPISTLGDVIPFVGNLLGAGIGLFAALVSVALSTLTIGIAWVLYRPLLAAVLLAVTFGAIYLLRSVAKGRRPKSRRPQAPLPPLPPTPPLPPVPSA